MNPADILGTLGLTMDVLKATNEGARAFQVLRSAADSWNKFQTLYSQLPTKPFGLSASLAYRLGTFWTDPGKYIGMLDPMAAIPRAFTQMAYRTERETLAEANYRYDITVTLHFPATGDKQSFHMHVDSEVPMSANEAYNAAFEQLMGQFSLARYDIDFSGAEDYFSPELAITNAFRLIRR